MEFLNPEWARKAGADLSGYFEAIRRAESRVLMLDYDGTLAPFRVEREKAFPFAGVREVLDRIIAAKECRVVLVTGRAVQDLVPLLGLRQRPEIWGTHGLERLAAGAEAPQVGRIPERAKQGLEEAGDWATQEGLSERTERKVGAIALHWRDLLEAEKETLVRKAMARWLPLSEASGLVLHSFDGGLELRVAGQSKAMAVEAILAEDGPGAAVAYLGDDLTDEDAFSALKGKGLCVLVRPLLRATHADLWLQPPAELMDFLEGWAKACHSHR